MELNEWALSILIEAYEKVYNDGTTLPKDAKKIKKIIDLLKKDKQSLLSLRVKQ